jgi:hypothetical protein
VAAEPGSAGVLGFGQQPGQPRSGVVRGKVDVRLRTNPGAIHESSWCRLGFQDEQTAAATTASNSFVRLV